MLSPDVLRKEILPQLEIVGLIRQEPDENKKSRMLVYPTVSTTYNSERIAENEGKTLDNYTKNIGGQDSGVTAIEVTSTTTDTDSTTSSNDSNNIVSTAVVDGTPTNTNDLVEVMKVSMGSKGFFTENDFIYTLTMRPRQEGWNEDNAAQTLQSLLQEGRIIEEIGPGRYIPK
jgi:hypothetical protein